LKAKHELERSNYNKIQFTPKNNNESLVLNLKDINGTKTIDDRQDPLKVNTLANGNIKFV